MSHPKAIYLISDTPFLKEIYERVRQRTDIVNAKIAMHAEEIKKLKKNASVLDNHETEVVKTWLVANPRAYNPEIHNFNFDCDMGVLWIVDKIADTPNAFMEMVGALKN